MGRDSLIIVSLLEKERNIWLKNVVPKDFGEVYQVRAFAAAWEGSVLCEGSLRQPLYLSNHRLPSALRQNEARFFL